MTTPNLGNRPLSPFMLGSTYRFQMSSVTSLIHRLTGVGLFFSFLFLGLWIISMATEGWFFQLMNWLVVSWIGKLAFLLSIWAIWYHLLNGIRHLVWDLGLGFNLQFANKTGWISILGSIFLTILSVITL